MPNELPADIKTVIGKPVTQTGATFTVALLKLTDGWRIAAWAWAKGGQ